jgi:hypothetical protein
MHQYRNIDALLGRHVDLYGNNNTNPRNPRLIQKWKDLLWYFKKKKSCTCFYGFKPDHTLTLTLWLWIFPAPLSNAFVDFSRNFGQFLQLRLRLDPIW